MFDCAAEYQGLSLNKVLMPGPDLVNSLVAVLNRFRRDEIALVPDIEAMFYQVRVTPKDRDSLRFLWWPGGNLDLKPVSHRMKVHLFGATSSPCCAAFCLRQSAIDFGQEFEPHVAHAIENNFYVDDLLISVSDSEICLKLVEGLRSLLAKAGFRLTKWLSNCEKVMNYLPKDEHSKLFKLSALDRDKDQHVERVLGINWKFNLDVFCFNISLPWKPRTKRGMLSTTV